MVNLNEMEDEVKADRISTHHIFAHGCGKIHLGLLVADPDPGDLWLMLEGIEELAHNLLSLVEEITPLETVLLPLLNVDGILGDTGHVHKILIVKVVREDMVVDGIVLPSRRPDPVDEGADSRVGTNGAEESGGRHGSLLDLIRICGNEFHFASSEEPFLDDLSYNDRIKIHSHRNRRRQRSDNERSRNQEPRDATQTDSAEHIQNNHCRKTEDEFDEKGRPHSQRRVKPQLDCQEDGIEQCRWTKVFNETHLQVLHVNKKKMDDATMVQQMTGCTREEAEKALLAHETVIDAISALIPANPVTAGNKYIPTKPKVDTGMDPEQIALCERGRWLQDKVNAVFSVGHSKTLPGPGAEQSASLSVAEVATLPLSAVVEVSESSPDSLVRTAQQALQSESPQ
jgi:hypothetical protein